MYILSNMYYIYPSSVQHIYVCISTYTYVCVCVSYVCVLWFIVFQSSFAGITLI